MSFNPEISYEEKRKYQDFLIYKGLDRVETNTETKWRWKSFGAYMYANAFPGCVSDSLAELTKGNKHLEILKNKTLFYDTDTNTLYVIYQKSYVEYNGDNIESFYNILNAAKHFGVKINLLNKKEVKLNGFLVDAC